MKKYKLPEDYEELVMVLSKKIEKRDRLLEQISGMVHYVECSDGDYPIISGDSLEQCLKDYRELRDDK